MPRPGSERGGRGRRGWKEGAIPGLELKPLGFRSGGTAMVGEKAGRGQPEDPGQAGREVPRAGIEPGPGQERDGEPVGEEVTGKEEPAFEAEEADMALGVAGEVEDLEPAPEGQDFAVAQQMVEGDRVESENGAAEGLEHAADAAQSTVGVGAGEMTGIERVPVNLGVHPGADAAHVEHVVEVAVGAENGADGGPAEAFLAEGCFQLGKIPPEAPVEDDGLPFLMQEVGIDEPAADLKQARLQGADHGAFEVEAGSAGRGGRG